MVLVTLSHLVNLVVVTIIPLLILLNVPAMTAVYGPDTPARRILACLYATIAWTSGAALLAQFAFGKPELSVQIALVLFPLQIAYKLGDLDLSRAAQLAGPDFDPYFGPFILELDVSIDGRRQTIRSPEFRRENMDMIQT